MSIQGQTLAIDFGGVRRIEFKTIPTKIKATGGNVCVTFRANIFRSAKNRLSKITSKNKIFTSSKFYKFRNPFEFKYYCETQKIMELFSFYSKACFPHIMSQDRNPVHEAIAQFH